MREQDPALGSPLLELMAVRVRGPERDGLLALWLTLRVLGDATGTDPLPDRVTRRRLAALARRLARLTVPAPLRRALDAALAHVEEPTPRAVALALTQLVAPALDTLGPAAAEAVAGAARRAREEAGRPPHPPSRGPASPPIV